MAAQLDYGYSTPKGVAGGKVDIAYDEVITRKNEEADGVLKYGMAAMIGTSKGTGVKVPVTGATADQIEGIVLHAANTEHALRISLRHILHTSRWSPAMLVRRKLLQILQLLPQHRSRCPE